MKAAIDAEVATAHGGLKGAVMVSDAFFAVMVWMWAFRKA